MASATYAAPDQDAIGLRESLRILWSGRWLTALLAIILSLAAGLASWLTPPSYVATVLLSPVSNQSGSGQMGVLGSVASQLGGLASLAGLGSQADSRKSESIAVLQSEALTEHYIAENNLLPVLYYKNWDAAKSAWKNPSKAPTLWRAKQYFKQIRKVATDGKTGLVSLSVTWKDPHAAAKWANDLVKMANDNLRSAAIAEAERNVAYLNEQAAKTNVVEARQAIYQLLETEINKVMLARGSEEYAFKVLDPAVPPEKPSNYSVAVWMVIGFFGGVLLALPIVFIRARSAS